MNSIFWCVTVFGFGLIFGSFINALVWRLRQQLDDDGEAKKLSPKRAKDLSIAKGHSMCPHCKHILAAKDLVPIFSWLLLRGRCRYCKATISRQYPAVELLTAILFAVSYLAWPLSFGEAWQVVSFISWLIMLVGLVALAIYDGKWMILPDRILLPLVALEFVSLIIQFAFGRPVSDIVSVIVSMSISGGIFCVLFFVSKGKWIGFGDVKLGLLLGLILGSPQLAILQLFASSVIGLLWIAPGLISKKFNTNSKVPFGPFLIAGAYIALLWGAQIFAGYTLLINSILDSSF